MFSGADSLPHVVQARISLNLHGMLTLESVTQHEEEEYEEVVKKPAAKVPPPPRPYWCHWFAGRL